MMKEHTLENLAFHPVKSQRQPQESSHLIQSVLGGVSGMLMETTLHPMDTIRTRMKCNREEFLSFNQTIKRIYVREGPMAFFKGFSCTLSGSFTANGTYFYAYEKLKYTLRKKKLLNDDLIPFLSAFVGGLCQDIMYIPCDVVRTRMQLGTKQYDYKNIYDGIRKIVQREGVGKLYIGGPAFFALDIIHTSLTFGFYELFLKKFRSYFAAHIKETDLNLPLSIICSASAASISAIVTNPLDLIVTRMQMVNTATEKPVSIYGNIKRIYSDEGLKGFMKGYSGRIMYYSCAAVILFPTYEFLKKLYGVDFTHADD